MRYKIIRDQFYKNSSPLRKRKTVRGLIINDNKIALLHIKCTEPDFGYRNHLETPGGGIEDNEEPISALKRELLEETGFEVKDIEYLTTIGVEYKAINRLDVGKFYSCKLAKDTHTTHLMDYEKELFSSLKWYDLDKIDEIYQQFNNDRVNLLVHTRDLYAIHLYKKKTAK